MRKWRDMERQMAPSSQTFSQGGIRSSDWFSDRLKGKKNGDAVWLLPPRPPHVLSTDSYLFRALHISMVTSTDSAMVIG